MLVPKTLSSTPSSILPTAGLLQEVEACNDKNVLSATDSAYKFIKLDMGKGAVLSSQPTSNLFQSYMYVHKKRDERGLQIKIPTPRQKPRNNRFTFSTM